MNTSVRYSVIIPTRNRESLLKDSLRSILNQNYTDYEIIISDNSDRAYKLNDVLNHPAAAGKVKYYRTGGLTMTDNWNFAISKASGDWYIIVADKTILKLGTFSYIDACITNNPDCSVFTYEYDEYFDEENLFRSRIFGDNGKQISTAHLEKLLLSSKFVEFAHFSGRAYNSVVKGELIRSVISDFGKICVPHNPDYTFCYHLMSRVDWFIYIEPTPIIVRFRSLNGNDPYGNGGNYSKKGSLFLEWSAREEELAGGRFCSFVPIKGWLVYSILLNDFLNVVSLYRKIPPFSKLKYYALNFKDTCYRRSIGADVQRELSAWASALHEESLFLRILVQLWIVKQRFKNVFYFPYRSKLLTSIRNSLRCPLLRKPKILPLEQFNNVEECLETITLRLQSE